MKDISQSTFFLLVAVLLAVTFSFSKWEKKGKEATLTWDVSGYYLYLPAVFIYGDLRELTFMPDILERYEPTFELQQPFARAERPLRAKVFHGSGPAVLALLFARSPGG